VRNHGVAVSSRRRGLGGCSAAGYIIFWNNPMTTSEDQRDEIAAAREETHTTRRPCVPAIEKMLYEPIHVLDYGFIRVIDYMGDDAAVVQAARVSYGRGTKRIQEDRRLIRYLLRHQHTTPFEMAEIKFHVNYQFLLLANGFDTGQRT
jgi:Thymidylate synthase complementing protein